MKKKEKEVAMAFGKLVRERRKLKKMTQESLAEAVSVTSTAIRNIEHGKCCCKWFLWLEICGTLDIDILQVQKAVLGITV